MNLLLDATAKHDDVTVTLSCNGSPSWRRNLPWFVSAEKGEILWMGKSWISVSNEMMKYTSLYRGALFKSWEDEKKPGWSVGWRKWNLIHNACHALPKDGSCSIWTFFNEWYDVIEPPVKKKQQWQYVKNKVDILPKTLVFQIRKDCFFQIFYDLIEKCNLTNLQERQIIHGSVPPLRVAGLEFPPKNKI